MRSQISQLQFLMPKLGQRNCFAVVVVVVFFFLSKVIIFTCDLSRGLCLDMNFLTLLGIPNLTFFEGLSFDFYS